MAVERPEPERVAVDVDTLGGLAAEIRSLLGLTDWRGIDNVGLPFGDQSAFGPANGLGEVHDNSLKVAWGVVHRMESVSARLTQGLAEAARVYGTADRHSAAAVETAARRIRSAAVSPGD